MQKTCSKCGAEKSADDFYRVRDHWCKACHRLYSSIRSKAEYKAHPEKIYQKGRQRILFLRSWVREYKKQHGCVDCSEIDPDCLDFDHRDPTTKDYQISNMARRGIALEKIKAEILKCDVRCSNCHRKKHARERRDKNGIL